MKRSTVLVLLPILLFLGVYLLPLGWLPLTSPDETRYSEIPREMLASGDWIVPTLNGLQYFEKPPLGYWATAISIGLFGENRFAVRLPSALAVAGTALIVWLWVRRRETGSGREDLPSLATWIYLTCPLVFAIGSVAVLDNLLSLFVTGSIAALSIALEETPARRRRWLVAGGLFCGLAFLTKGFLALAVPGLVIGGWLAIRRRWFDMVRLAWLPLLTAAAVVAPWGIAVHFQAPDFWRYFFWVEHVRRFLDPVGRSQHPEPFWFFVPFLIAGILPWLVAVPAAIAGGFHAWRNRREDEPTVGPPIGLVWLWLVLPFLFFSASSGKLGTYILPCVPPLAVLLASGLTACFERLRAGASGLDLPSAAALGSMLGGLAAALALWLFGGKFYGAGEDWKWMAMIAALGIWAAVGFFALIARSMRRKAWLLGAAPLALYLAVRVAYPAEVAEGHAFDGPIEALLPQIAEDALVVTDSALVHAACWVLKRDDLVMFEWGGELRYGLERPGAAHRLLSGEQVAYLLTHRGRERDVVFLLDERSYAAWMVPLLEESLPSPNAHRREGGVVFLRFGAGEIADQIAEQPANAE